MAFDTTSHLSNLPMVEFLSEYLDRPGVRIARVASAAGDKTNLLVIAGPERPDGSGLMLCGHMDVVPAGEADWRTDPFTLTESGDTLVARGAADMKGFLALATNCLASLDLRTLRSPLALLFTYDEETGTHGARRFSEVWTDRAALPNSVVIGEPTSLEIVRAHKGMLRLGLEFEGQAAHSGYPHLGRSAIEPAARAILALTQLQQELERERPQHAEQFPDVPFAAVNVGTVRGGSAANVIPDRCEMDLGIRLLPGMAAEDMVERIRSTVTAAAGDAPFSLEYGSESPAMILGEDAEIYRQLTEAMGQRESRSVMFATDGGWLQRMGLQCVLFGPGSIEVAHRSNEFIPIAQLGRAKDVLQQIVNRRCVAA